MSLKCVFGLHSWSGDYTIKGDEWNRTRRKCLRCGLIQEVAYDIDGWYWTELKEEVEEDELPEYKNDDEVKE